MKKLALIVFFLGLTVVARADEVVAAGATSRCFDVFVSDSSSTTGAGLTGLVFNTASLSAYYHRSNAAAATSISLATMTLGTFTSSGFVVVDGTNQPGWYQFCPPDAAFAAGARSVTFQLKGATNMAQTNLRVLISPDVNIASATASALTESAFAPTNTFAAGSTTTISNLNASETANDISFQQLCVTSGTCSKKCCEITAYNTGTKAATCNLGCSPAAADGYSIGGVTRFTSVSGTTSSLGAVAVASGAQDVLTATNFTTVVAATAYPTTPTVGVKLHENFVPTMAWINTTWAAGSTLDVTLQHSPDGVNWKDLQAFTQVTTAAATEMKVLTSPVFRYVRAKVTTTTGTTVNYTTTLQLWGYLNRP